MIRGIIVTSQDKHVLVEIANKNYVDDNLVYTQENKTSLRLISTQNTSS